MSERRAFFGALALSVVNVAKLGAQFLILPILARKLGPAAYGLVALAMPFILVANMLSDGGLGAALARTNPSTADEQAAFTLTTAAGLALAGTCAALAWPLGLLIGQPGLSPVLAALSPILAISGALSIPSARITRERRFAVFANGDVIATAASLAAALGAAFGGLGAWSLVAQQLALWIAKAAWVGPASRFRPRLRFEPGRVRPHLGFGASSAGALIADFIGKNLVIVAIGAALGLVRLGQFSVAYQIVRIPEQVLAGPLYLAAFTAMARVSGDAAAARALAGASLRLLVAFLAPLFVGLALTADLIVGALFGPAWTPTGAIIAALSPAGFAFSFCAFAGAMLMGLGRADRQLVITLALAGALALGGALGVRFGVIGAAIGVSAGALALVPASVLTVAREAGLQRARLAADLARPLAAAAAMAVLVLALRERLSGASAIVELAIVVAAGAPAYLAALALLARRTLAGDIRGLMPERAGRPPLGAVTRTP